MSDFVAADAGSRLVHGPQFRRGAVVDSERTKIQVVVSPFMGNSAEHPGQVSGFFHHGWVNADAANRDDECGNVERFSNVIFQFDLLIEREVWQNRNVGGLLNVIARRNDQCQRRGRIAIEYRWQSLTAGGETKFCESVIHLAL